MKKRSALVSDVNLPPVQGPPPPPGCSRRAVFSSFDSGPPSAGQFFGLPSKERVWRCQPGGHAVG